MKAEGAEFFPLEKHWWRILCWKPISYDFDVNSCGKISFGIHKHKTLKFSQYKSISGVTFFFSNSATDHFWKTISPNGNPSGHNGSNDTSLISLWPPGAESIACHTHKHTDRIRILLYRYTIQKDIIQYSWFSITIILTTQQIINSWINE
jgi:hypothetical protein